MYAENAIIEMGKERRRDLPDDEKLVLAGSLQSTGRLRYYKGIRIQGVRTHNTQHIPWRKTESQYQW